MLTQDKGRTGVISRGLRKVGWKKKGVNRFKMGLKREKHPARSFRGDGGLHL